MKKKLKGVLFSGLMLVGTGYLVTASAWTDEIEKLGNINSICKFEPEAQCSWAVRVNAQAPGVDMHEASMASMRLDGANLQGANLSRSILQLASLKGSNLMLANLEGAHMHGVNLQQANLMLANLTRVNLLDANLAGANLRGANLQGAILMKANLNGAIWTDGRTCAAGSIGECL